jgi:predicted transcriptional regulator
MNTRVPEDVKNWLDEQAAKDDRDRGYILNKLIRPMMASFEQVEGDAHLQQSLRGKGCTK